MKCNRWKEALAILLACSMVCMASCKKEEETKSNKDLRFAMQFHKNNTIATEGTSAPTPTPAPTDTPMPTSTLTPTPAPFTSSFRSEDAEAYMESIQFDGTVLVAEQGQIVWTYSSGYADRLNRKDNKEDTVFEFGSITKQFTAVAVMQLVEQGKLNLDDTLDQYIPEYNYAGKITIHQLLNMTSGVPDYLACGILGFSTEDFENLDLSDIIFLEDTLSDIATTPLAKEVLVEKISDFPLNFEPGTQFEYSNTNYYFLGMIIEQLSGMAYDEYIRQNILNPLGLTDLYPDTDHMTSNGRTQLSFLTFDLPHQHESISYAVGVMTGTAEGLFHWEECVMNRALLSEESWAKILDGGQFGYGYGWYINSDSIEHSGMTLGYNTSVRVDSDHRRVVIVLSNIQPLESTSERPMSEEICAQLWNEF